MILGSNALMILSHGLPALALACLGIWILRRETSEVIRAVGYLLIGLGIFSAAGALIGALIGFIGMLGF